MYKTYYQKSLRRVEINLQLKKALQKQLFSTSTSFVKPQWLFLPTTVVLAAFVLAIVVSFAPFSLPKPFSSPSDLSAESLLVQAQELPTKEGEVIYLKTRASFSFGTPDDVEEFWTDGKNYLRQMNNTGEYPSMTLSLKNDDGTYTVYTYTKGSHFQFDDMDQPAELIGKTIDQQPQLLSDQFSQLFTIGNASSTPFQTTLDSDIALSNTWWSLFLRGACVGENVKTANPNQGNPTCRESAHIVGEEIINGKDTYVIQASINYAGIPQSIGVYRGWISKDTRRFVQEEISNESSKLTRVYEEEVVRQDLVASDWFNANAWKKREGIADLREYPMIMEFFPGMLRMSTPENHP